jgi:Kef-type K+ transport system membrane component KefB
MVIAVVAQFFLAAFGAFDSTGDDPFEFHSMLGYLLSLFAVLVTIVGALAKMPGRLIGMTGLVAGLILVQSLIRALADALNDSGDTSTTSGQIVFGLHAINGLAIMAVSGQVARQSRALLNSVEAREPAADSAQRAS